jgi:hypothetical protein
MPHILIHSTDMTKGIQVIHMDVKVQFNSDYFRKTSKVNEKMNELESKLQMLLSEYFDTEIESEILTNHEYNKIK